MYNTYWAMADVLIGSISRCTLPPSCVLMNENSSSTSTSNMLLRTYYKTYYFMNLCLSGKPLQEHVLFNINIKWNKLISKIGFHILGQVTVILIFDLLILKQSGFFCAVWRLWGKWHPSFWMKMKCDRKTDRQVKSKEQWRDNYFSCRHILYRRILII